MGSDDTLTLEYISFAPPAGIDKKIKGQINALKKYKIEGYPTYIKGRFVLSYLHAIFKLLSSKADIIYIRNLGPFMFILIPALKLLRHTKMLILELPTPLFATYHEIKDNPHRNKLINIVRTVLFNLSFPLVLKYFDILVEYGDEDLKYKSGLDGKIIKITNGVSLEDIPLRRSYVPHDGLCLIGVANIAFWHGYDRVLLGMGRYYARTPTIKVQFHVVGDGPEKPSLVDLAKSLDIEEYVIFHGKLMGKDLDDIYNYCDIGIGSLGLHRESFPTATTLKAREYCARGIPFILSNKDPDFSEDLPFVYYVSSDDAPVQISNIVKFWETTIERIPKIFITMRVYARRRLTWDTRMGIIARRIYTAISMKG